MSATANHLQIPNWPFRAASAVTIVNVLVSSGFAIAGLLAPRSILPADLVPTAAAAVFAAYAASRALPIAGGVVWAVARRSSSLVATLGAIAGSVQVLDGVVGLLQGDPSKVLGPWAIAVLQFGTIVWLIGSQGRKGDNRPKAG